MDNLTQALNSLTHQDGTPDTQARMFALDNLALALTPQEVRRLRSQLNVWQWDALSEFPMEIILLIMEYIELEDVVRLRMGGSLKTIDISIAEAYMCGFHIVLGPGLFYPGSARGNDDGHFFFVCRAYLKVSIDEPVKHKVKLVVAEFVNCQHKAIYCLDQPWEGPEQFSVGKVSIIDDDGLICISWKDRITPSYPQLPPTCHHKGYLGDPVFGRIVLVTFNMSTRQFATRSHHIPAFVTRGADDFETRLDSVHIWRNQVLLPAFSTTLGKEPGSPDTALVAIDYCDRLSQMGGLEIPSYETSIGSLDKQLILNDKILPHQFGITHCWIGGNYFDEMELDACDTTYSLQGDDNFIVLFLPQKILIWYFEGQPSPSPFQVPTSL
ncbi:hypothetical protein B7494_g156 [Chlorociboria aeruginascens]|nr:hypothetical protein B7494_g156 [Chlorociboria aeruginascens]